MPIPKASRLEEAVSFDRFHRRSPRNSPGEAGVRAADRGCRVRLLRPASEHVRNTETHTRTREDAIFSRSGRSGTAIIHRAATAFAPAWKSSALRFGRNAAIFPGDIRTAHQNSVRLISVRLAVGDNKPVRTTRAAHPRRTQKNTRKTRRNRLTSFAGRILCCIVIMTVDSPALALPRQREGWQRSG